MNLEDFKSFRRVLIPSEVGSIPTHSRQLVGVIAALAAGTLLLGGSARAAGANAAPPANAAEGSAAPPASAKEAEAPPAKDAKAAPPITPSPFQRAVRSAVFPAWGQLTNGKSKKAVILFSVQTYVITRIIDESRAAHASQRRGDALVAASLEDSFAAQELRTARAAAQDHFNTRREMLFWAFLGGFYGAMDAYVDAHLGNFGEELAEGRKLFADADPVARSVEIGVRF